MASAPCPWGGCSCPASSPEMQREQPQRGPAGGGRHWQLLVFPCWFQMGLLAVDLAIPHTHPPLPPWALPPRLYGASPVLPRGFNGAKEPWSSRDSPAPPRAAHRSPCPCPRPVGWSRELVIKLPTWLACAQPVPSRCRSSRVAARKGQGLASGRPPGLRKAPGGRQPPLPIAVPPGLIPVPVPHGPYRPAPAPGLCSGSCSRSRSCSWFRAGSRAPTLGSSATPPLGASTNQRLAPPFSQWSGPTAPEASPPISGEPRSPRLFLLVGAEAWREALAARGALGTGHLGRPHGGTAPVPPGHPPGTQPPPGTQSSPQGTLSPPAAPVHTGCSAPSPPACPRPPGMG